MKRFGGAYCTFPVHRSSWFTGALLGEAASVSGVRVGGMRDLSVRGYAPSSAVKLALTLCAVCRAAWVSLARHATLVRRGLVSACSTSATRCTVFGSHPMSLGMACFLGSSAGEKVWKAMCVLIV